MTLWTNGQEKSERELTQPYRDVLAKDRNSAVIPKNMLSGTTGWRLSCRWRQNNWSLCSSFQCSTTTFQPHFPGEMALKRRCTVIMSTDTEIIFCFKKISLLMKFWKKNPHQLQDKGNRLETNVINRTTFHLIPKRQPCLYGPRKTHKEGAFPRPIVSSITFEIQHCLTFCQHFSTID